MRYGFIFHLLSVLNPYDILNKKNVTLKDEMWYYLESYISPCCCQIDKAKQNACRCETGNLVVVKIT